MTTRPENTTPERPAGRDATPRRRSRGPQPVADLVVPCLGPALAAQGFASAELALHWAEIVGPEIAARAEPVKIQWPPRPQGSGSVVQGRATLVVRVEGAFALELQHMADVVVARANAYLGWACIGSLRLRQGPLERRKVEKPPAPKPPTPEARAEVARAVDGIGEARLREALTRLGLAVTRA